MRGRIVLAGALLLSACSESSPEQSKPESAASGIHNGPPILAYGVYNQEDFELNWAPHLPHSNDMTNQFRDWFSAGWQQLQFQYDLVGTRPYIEDTLDQNESDNVDVLWLATHGAAVTNASTAMWSMWPQPDWIGGMIDPNSQHGAFTANMRWGDEAWNLKLFVTYSCSTLRYNDGQAWTRWDNVMKGGLKYVLGSHDIVIFGWSNAENGKQFALNSLGHWRLWDAWIDANGDWATANDVAALATGANESDCWTRLGGMRLDDVAPATTYRDNNVGWWCLDSRADL
jgi:Family of unknown function (DUF6345)